MAQFLRSAWHRFRPHIPRLWWGGLLALHVPILVGVLMSLTAGDLTGRGLLSAGSLVFAIIFFGLKLRDPRFLHFGSAQRSFLAWCLVIALAHTGAAERHSVHPAVLETTAVVAVQVTIALELLKRKRELLGKLTDLLAGFGAVAVPLAGWRFAQAPQRRRLPQLAYASAVASRGPPVSC